MWHALQDSTAQDPVVLILSYSPTMPLVRHFSYLFQQQQQGEPPRGGVWGGGGACFGLLSLPLQQVKQVQRVPQHTGVQ